MAVAIILGVSALPKGNAATGASLTADQIIRNSVAANERDWRAAPEYSYTETTRDSHGSKTTRVTMLLGSPYEQLLRRNGKALSPEDQKREKEKFDAAFSERKSESRQETADRIAKYEKDRRRDHLMMEQLTNAFRFRLTGEKKLYGRSVYTLRATPRADYRPPNMEAEVLTGMKGDLWIDKQTFQWVKVLAQVVSPVSIGGFLATVQPGTYFELEKAPVAGGIWLPKHFRVQSQSKVLSLFRHDTQEDDTYLDYQKTPAEYLA
ncbi:MAG TPA: hypothetical protein VHB50_17645, partial [Bryobacteraceae bacterium]|nr:hypothetical protein [Bryobacteraceae bacterium]